MPEHDFTNNDIARIIAQLFHDFLPEDHSGAPSRIAIALNVLLDRRIIPFRAGVGVKTLILSASGNYKTAEPETTVRGYQNGVLYLSISIRGSIVEIYFQEPVTLVDYSIVGLLCPEDYVGRELFILDGSTDQEVRAAGLDIIHIMNSLGGDHYSLEMIRWNFPQ
ncbi:MAG: hypothetical protein PHS44_03970 [Candidatus Dojkabacteria bacterium]|jgi:hypothetical protein|nr:hypothetical protein [Candidatus Dojkabacteria bacterium]